MPKTLCDILNRDPHRSGLGREETSERYVPLPNLRELELRFPITYDFGRFFPTQTTSVRIPVEDVTQGLRHLGVYSCEYTDQS
jgi:hypothetical protein